MGENPPKLKIDWGERLRDLCQAKGWETQAETFRVLAEAVGVSARTVEGWWQRRHRPDKRARAILRAMWREAVEKPRASEVG